MTQGPKGDVEMTRETKGDRKPKRDVVAGEIEGDGEEETQC